jgi:DNA-binding NtrC family response regulator
MRRLHRYSFPGNVRELRNVIERAVTFAAGDRVEEGDLPDRVREPGRAQTSHPARAGLPDPVLQEGDDILPTLDDIQMRYIRYVLERVGGNKRRAAALLGVSRRTLYRRLERAAD